MTGSPSQHRAGLTSPHTVTAAAAAAETLLAVTL